VLAGRAPAGSTLRLKKTFQTPTSQGTTFTDTLDSTMQVGADGRCAPCVMKLDRVDHVPPSVLPRAWTCHV
jgi:hypothetical protein